MDISNVEIDRSATLAGRQKIAEKLEVMLTELPIEIRGSFSKLKAHVGLGKIVYIQPIDGEIRRIRLDEIELDASKQNKSSGLCFEYQNQSYVVEYS